MQHKHAICLLVFTTLLLCTIEKEYYVTEYYITIDKRLIKVYEKLQHALFYTLY